MKRTSLELPTGIGVGSTVTAECWTTNGAPGVVGDRYDTEREAIVHAIYQREIADLNHREAGREPLTIPLHIERRLTMTISTREGYKGEVDSPVSRTAYDDVADAQEHLDRIDRYAGVGVPMSDAARRATMGGA